MSQYLGDISAYALAVSQGYTGTEEEYAELMASYATVGQTAVNAAQTATTKASEAATSATTATTKASEAASSATTATTKAGEASTSASTATSAKDTAVSASQTATTKATEATTAAATATSAKTDAVAANTAAQSAKTAAQTAQTGAETAAASVQSSAAQIQTNADDISELKEDLTRAFPHDTASGAVASFSDGADDVPMDSVIVNIEPVQSGSGDPSPTNVRPISGWSEVNVQRTGVNVWDEEWTNGRWSANQGVLNPAFTSYVASKNKIPVKPQTTYYFFVNTSATTAREIVYYDISENWISDAPSTYANDTFTTPSGCYYINFNLGGGYGNTYHNDVSINYPPTDHDYHPYSGQSINISLGQTVYGGKLDVTIGVLTVDRAMVDLGTLNWTMGQANIFNVSVTKANSSNNLISMYTTVASYADMINTDKCFYNGGSTLQAFYIHDNSYQSVSAFQTAVTGQQLVYELATPLTISLTPHEVTALLGSNNVRADAGDSAVEYRADPTLYIQRLTEPDADMVADSNITSGQYFMVGNSLYKATANIASGGAITPNVNCTRKSLSEALNEINA